MKLAKIHLLHTFAITIFLLLLGFYSRAQDNIYVQVKIFDLNLTPFPNLEITIDDFKPTKTDSKGICFLSLPKASLPPSKIAISDQNLEAESWNYSKGILEIIVRERKYQTFKFKIVDHKSNLPIVGIEVVPGIEDPHPLVTDVDGSFSLVIPKTVEFRLDNFFKLSGYKIIRSELNGNLGLLTVERVLTEEFFDSAENSSQISQQKIVTNGATLNPDKPKVQQKTLEDIEINDLDSINSLTVLFTLIKNLDFQEMDSVTKIKLDKKFYELSRLNTLSSLLATPALELINDSSIINDDLLLLIEKIQNEGSLLDNFRDEFEVATNKIKIKLGDGGEKLSLDERQLLLQLIMNLKELLRKNEERFYRNNKYYRDEIENLQNQLSNIIDLEDKLIESEEAQKKFKQQLIYISLTLAALIGFAFLLIYLLRIFISQRNELMSANNEIEAINNNLAGIVDEKTKSMEQINKELDTFIYKSSHNLRRPITSIKGLANLAKLTLNNEGIMLFEKVTDVSNDMEKMIDKLSMMNFINQPTGYNRIDFEQLIQKIEKHYSEQIKGSNILFKWDIKLAHDFKSYPSVVELIVQNLVENAFFYCQYTNKKQPAVEICIDLDPSEKNLILSVQDNGCGIDPEYQEKVWNMFFVANIASKGNGLGLYITKKAVESLKGTITLDTKVGTYCNFDIVLPLDYADSEDSLIS